MHHTQKSHNAHAQKKSYDQRKVKR